MGGKLEDALLQVVLNQSNEGIHMVDTKGITKYYNSAAGRMDGLEGRDVLGRSVLEAFPSLNRDTSTLIKVAGTGLPIVDQQQSYTNKNGTEITTINTTLPIFGQQAELLGAVELARDITRIQQLAEQVLDLRRRLYSGAPPQDSRQAAVYTFTDIIGSSPALKQVLAQAAQTAHTSSPILVTGETGTGKELLVQAIHNGGPRHLRPFVAQNCAALPETLLEIILFGSVRGSFTGAQDRPGLFELANGGTLFLDELNSMPPQLQAKLLRVLETGELRRLGDTRERRVDVRIITAMAADPSKALRSDLYYRLNVVRLSLPPLRDRRGDIPVLCKHFIRQFNSRFGTRVTGLALNAAMKLENWRWPGNIRELANLLEGILNFRTSGEITLQDFPDFITRAPDKKTTFLRVEVERVEKQLICQAMDETGGNVSRAAEILDLPRQTLQRKLRKIQWHDNCNR